MLFNTQATTVTIQRGRKFKVTECPLNAYQYCTLKRINELKSFSNFPDRPTDAELANKLVLPEIEHQIGKISEKELDSLREVLNQNTDVFSKHKADKGCCNFVEHEIEIE